MTILLLMGVLNFPATQDYWDHDTRFDLIANITPRKRFQLLRQFIHFNDNQQCNDSPDRFYNIRPPL